MMYRLMNQKRQKLNRKDIGDTFHHKQQSTINTCDSQRRLLQIALTLEMVFFEITKMPKVGSTTKARFCSTQMALMLSCLLLLYIRQRGTN